MCVAWVGHKVKSLHHFTDKALRIRSLCFLSSYGGADIRVGIWTQEGLTHESKLETLGPAPAGPWIILGLAFFPDHFLPLPPYFCHFFWITLPFLPPHSPVPTDAQDQQWTRMRVCSGAARMLMVEGVVTSCCCSWKNGERSSGLQGSRASCGV